MTTSKDGIALLKSLEGCRLEAYPDGNSYSIGYGHNGVAHGTRITQDEAERLLAEDLRQYEGAVQRYTAPATLTRHQFDALVSLCYNIGTGAFASSTVARLVKADPTPREELSAAWARWRLYKGEVYQPLVRRREKEYAHYCTDDAADNVKKNC